MNFLVIGLLCVLFIFMIVIAAIMKISAKVVGTIITTVLILIVGIFYIVHMIAGSVI